MNGIELYKAIDMIDEKHIDEALGARPIRRHRVKRAVIKAIAIAAALIIAFAGTVNLFPVTAYALSGIPVLGDIARALTFDPSMKECLSHDYVQYVGESQTVDGYHSEVHCMVVDANRISVFFTSDVPTCINRPSDELYIEANQESTLGRCYYGIVETAVEGLYEFRIDLKENESIPDSFVFIIQYRVCDNLFFENPKEVARTEYTLYPDKQYSTVVESYEINSTVEFMGQTIHIDRLDIYPTQSKLYFSTDEANTTLLRDITIALVDETGRVYPQRSNGVIATGTGNGEVRSQWFESPYFSQAESLTLQITAISFQDKDKRYGTVDFTNQTISNMPEGISVVDMILDDEGALEITLKVPESINQNVVSVSCTDVHGNYYDPEYSMMPAYAYEDLGREAEEGYQYHSFSIPDYMDVTCEIAWVYAPETVLETPIVIPVFGSQGASIDPD